MKSHELILHDLVDYLSDNKTRWITYDSSAKEDKWLEVAIGDCDYRVLHGREIVYEGFSMRFAVQKYNEIVSKPINVPKL